MASIANSIRKVVKTAPDTLVAVSATIVTVAEGANDLAKLSRSYIKSISAEQEAEALQTAVMLEAEVAEFATFASSTEGKKTFKEIAQLKLANRIAELREDAL